MDDDIVTRLREHADDEKKAGAYVLRDALSDGADEIERLTEWRSNALLALDKRENEIERLRLELEEQRYWNSVLQEQVKYTI